MSKSNMRTLSTDLYKEIESAAHAGARAVREYLQGTSRKPETESFKRARVGISAVGSYVRLAATETNREALRLAATQRLPVAALPPSEEQ